MQFQSCDGSSYFTALGGNNFTDIVSHQLQDLCSYEISGELTKEFKNCEVTVLQYFFPHTFHQFWHHQGWSVTTVFVVHIGSAFSQLPAPSSDHTVTHMSGPYMWHNLCWRFLLSMQKSDNCTNLTVGRRQYQCSDFLLVLCNNYCHHKTEIALHYSHILPSTSMHAHSRPTSQTISRKDWN